MNWKTQFAELRIWTAMLGSLAMLAGCAHHQEFSGAEQRAMATPPKFLTGPMALVLTNDRSYTAQIVFESRTAWGSTQRVTGNFTAAGSKLAFEPESPKSSQKYAQAKMVFVWDAVQSSGYALNDALQGYAPYPGTAQFTNFVAAKRNTAPQQIGGHECEQETATVLGNDGSINLLQIWRAADLRGFPLKIDGGTNAGVLMLSRVQFGAPAHFLMSQEGFTRYESPDAMVTEIIARQHNLNRKEGQAFSYPDMIEQNRVRPGQPY
jgi:hypothetical protein